MVLLSLSVASSCEVNSAIFASAAEHLNTREKKRIYRYILIMFDMFQMFSYLQENKMNVKLLGQMNLSFSIFCLEDYIFSTHLYVHFTWATNMKANRL